MHLSFDDCALDRERREFRRKGEILPLQPQVFDLLLYLVENRDRVVSKDDVLAGVWDGRVVSESTLASRINAVRNAIGDTGADQKLIRTIPKKGFRFVGQVHKLIQAPPDIANAPRSLLSRLPPRPTILVLPFKSLSGKQEQSHFCNGLSEELTSALSLLRWFTVVSRNSPSAGNVSDGAQAPGIDYIVDGSVRRSGQRIRVSCYLIDARSGIHLWTDRYEREVTETFSLQDEITSCMVAAIEPKLIAAEGFRLEDGSPQAFDAWNLVVRAFFHFLKFTAEGSAAAILLLKQAVQTHPDYAPGHSVLACVLALSSYVGWTAPLSDRELAFELADRSVELDEADPWTHMSRGILAMTGRNTDEAVGHLQTALDLNRNFVSAIGFIGLALSLDGRSDEALTQLERVTRTSPRDPFSSFFLAGGAVAHYLNGRFGEAVEGARCAVRLRPGYTGARRILCASLAQAGLHDEAKSTATALQGTSHRMSLACVKEHVPYTQRTMGTFLEGLRMAGVR